MLLILVVVLVLGLGRWGLVWVGAEDCGVCQETGVCGDGTCDDDENCGNCARDCYCPPVTADVKALAVPVLEHRIILNPSAQLRDLDASSVIAEVLAGTPVPGGAFEA